MEKAWWICGQLRGNYKSKGSIWDFQGVFSSRAKAIKACRNENYFIFSARLDQELPDERMEAPDAVYPKAC